MDDACLVLGHGQRARFEPGEREAGAQRGVEALGDAREIHVRGGLDVEPQRRHHGSPSATAVRPRRGSDATIALMACG